MPYVKKAEYDRLKRIEHDRFGDISIIACQNYNVKLITSENLNNSQDRFVQSGDIVNVNIDSLFEPVLFILSTSHFHGKKLNIEL